MRLQGLSLIGPVWIRAFSAAILLACTAQVFSSGAQAQGARDFYKGQTISIVVGYRPGGGYDQSARILAKHFPRHIPGNPTMVVRNMPGAGTVVAANYVNNTAPKDGTVIGLYADLTTIAPLLRVKGIQFDPRKFGWLGSMASRGTPVVMVRADSPATTYAQAREKEILIGASGPDATSAYAYLANDTLGTKFKVLAGYTGGTSEISLAIERGEVHGRASGDWYTLKSNQADWLTKKFITVMIQMSLKANPDLPGVPTALELAKTEADRQVIELVLGTSQFFRAFSLAEGVPPERLAILREAFSKTAKDPDFIKDWKTGFPAGVDYSDYKSMEAFLHRVYAFPESVVERARQFVK
jgi:tripartite-type tricarboxylate transporter receptor subunit TctC